MIKQPAILDTIRDLKDRSGKLAFVTRELSNNEFNKLRDLRGLEGWILFDLNEIQEEEIPKEPAEMESKTPSQRLRSVLFILWKQQGEKGEFKEFYRKRMEEIIQAIKNKLE